MARMVECTKLGRTLPGMESPPFPGPLGERIHRDISQEAWDLWKQREAEIIEVLVTEYPLQPNDPDIQEFLRRETHRDDYTVYVRPEMVVEIAFSDLQASPRYPGGMALRFARVKGYRPDKRASEADTVDTVRAIHARAE